MGRNMIVVELLPDSEIPVGYSRRKHGLINKAKELGVLCGNQVVLIVFNPDGSDVEEVATNGNVMDILQRFVDFREYHLQHVHSVQVSSTGAPKDHPQAPPNSTVNPLTVQPTGTSSSAQGLNPAVRSTASTSNT
ncbi:MADS-box transcription factor ANR1 [Physcomitrium patens]|uniref:MADS-box domain-containing protein n=1 Tax=Physcomitrium patens TaxID=3218 RepID=A9TBF7_PHYPA|nr:MADS-box transcription factor ANR1-like [Physcomitrium patens]PNR58329.1 hypothetical protein PHYPA_005324 [Physcomitrium patens]|eukprot:XP_024371836.1 MADS-box transcription factor ANR1-like [Physcomitrella patens]